MTTQSNIDRWGSNSESNDNDINEDAGLKQADESGDQGLPQPLLDHMEQFKEARLREIPFAERYPVWWGRLRKNGMSAKSLAELKKCTSRASFHFDDREDDNWEDQFVEVHLHTG